MVLYFIQSDSLWSIFFIWFLKGTWTLNIEVTFLSPISLITITQLTSCISPWWQCHIPSMAYTSIESNSSKMVSEKSRWLLLKNRTFERHRDVRCEMHSGLCWRWHTNEPKAHTIQSIEDIYHCAAARKVTGRTLKRWCTLKTNRGSASAMTFVFIHLTAWIIIHR